MNVVCFVGSDGSGKTTLAKAFVSELQRQGVRTDLFWSRYNNLTSRPLLLLARLLGHTHYIDADGVKMGFHDFEKVWWLRWPFAFLQMIDATVARRRLLRKIGGRYDVAVFERSCWDTLADVMADTGLRALAASAVGRGMLGSFRQHSKVVLVTRPKGQILASRHELKHDYKLDAKIAAYEQLADRYGWTRFDNSKSLDDALAEVRNMAREASRG